MRGTGQGILIFSRLSLGSMSSQCNDNNITILLIFQYFHECNINKLMPRRQRRQRESLTIFCASFILER